MLIVTKDWVHSLVCMRFCVFLECTCLNVVHVYFRMYVMYFYLDYLHVYIRAHACTGFRYV